MCSVGRRHGDQTQRKMDPNNPTPHTLLFTTPLVFYAIFRYALVITRGQLTGPTDVLIHDKPFLITALLWTVMAVGLIVFDRQVSSFLPQLRYPGESVPTDSASAVSQPSRM